MREILFKAKRKNWHELSEEEWWIEGYPVKYQPCASKNEYVYGIAPTYASALYIIEIDPETLCQYIGKNDKNGKLIWENDIVKIGANTLVRWNGKYAGWCLTQKGWMYDHFFGEAISPCDCEVVGNVFDNPDLFELRTGH